jgi:anthranilate phosphoribosyltransferase
VLGELGKTAAYVVHGADGLDEFSTSGVNIVSHLRNGKVTSFELDSAELGLPHDSLDDMIGGLPEENALITRAVLSGADRGPRRDIVLLNAAAALSTESGDMAAGLSEARQAIDSGAAIAKLDAWVAKTNSFQA